MIKNVKLYVNESEKALSSAKTVREKFESNNFNIVDENYDLVVAVGGDGTFLGMVREENFNSDVYYIGVNAGHLGFLQEAKVEDMDKLIDEIQKGKYKVLDTDILETVIKHADGETKLYSINDAVISDVRHSKALKATVYRHDGLIETFFGTAIILCTSLGSTSYSKSEGGCLVPPELSTIQFTPVAPIDSSAFRTLSNSNIETDKGYFEIVPYNDDIIVCYDCEEDKFKNVVDIVSRISDKKIKRLCFGNYSYAQRINEKFLQ